MIPLPRTDSQDRLRLKELRGLYAATEAIAHSTTCAELFDRICKLVPPAWQYPQITRCRIVFDGHNYQSQAFEESKWCQSIPIRIGGKVRGHIEVFYLEERPALQQGPFRSEEGELIQGLAEMLATAVGRIEADRARSEFLQIIEASPAMVFKLNNHPGRPVDYVSANVEGILGYSPEDFTSGRVSYTSIVHPDDQGLTQICCIKPGDTQQGTISTYRVLGKAGQVHWVDDRTTAVRDSNGVITHYQGIILDVTARKRNEELLQIRVRLSEIANDHSLFEFLEQAINEMERLTDSEIGFCHSLADNQEFLTLQAWSTNTQDHANKLEGYSPHSSVSEAGVWTECVRQRKTVVNNDYAGLPNKKGLPAEHMPLIRQLITPVFRGSKIVAIFGVGNKSREYTQVDIDLIESLSDAVWDIAAAKMAQDRLLVANRALRIISEFNQALVRTTTESALLTEACKILVERGGYRLAWIGFAEDNQEKSVRLVASCGTGRDYLRDLNITWADTPRGRGPTGTAIRTQRATAARNILTDPELAPWRQSALDHGYASSLAVPFIAGDVVLGAVNVYSTRTDAFDQQECEILIELARDIGHGVMALRAKMQHRQREEALRQSEGQLQSIFSSTPDFLALLDRDHRIQMINRVESGATMQDVLGHPLTRFIVREDRPAVVEALRTVIEQAQPGRFEARHLHVDGSIGHYSVVAAPLLVSGEVVGSVVSSRDITDTVKLQEEKLKFEGLYRQAQKMEAIGRLAGGVAHDFNNLLTVINSYSSMAIESLRPEDPLCSDLNEILSAGERAARLTHRLLAFSRKQVVSPRVIDLNSVVLELESMLRRLIGEDIRLSTDLASELSCVRADAGQVEQILMNLAVNARDAMVTGGRLEISTANVHLLADDVADHEALQPGPYVRLRVRDDGVGMSAPTIEKIFEPFFTTKKVGQGTGLGLAMVYGIVKQSEGTVVVDSTIDIGTTFSIYLPVVDEAVTSQSSEARTRSSVAGTGTILVVEDEGAVRELTARVLTSAGYTVIEATNGNDALLLYQGRHPDIDLVLTDVVMPQMSGPELAKRMATIEPQVKLVFMSGYAGDRMTNHGFVEQGSGFLNKPFTSTDLLQEIEKSLKAQRQLTPDG